MGTLTNSRPRPLATYRVMSVITPDPTATIESVSTSFNATSRRDTLVSSASRPLRSEKHSVAVRIFARESSSMRRVPSASAVLRSMTTSGLDHRRLSA